MWQTILTWLLKNIWPAVQALLAKLLIDFVGWIFDQVKDSYRGHNRRQQDKARQKAAEAEERAKQSEQRRKEAEQRAAEARRKFEEAEQRAKKAEAQVGQYEADMAKLKAEIEWYKAELENLQDQADVEKQRTIAGVWREVTEMLGQEQEIQEDNLEQIRETALARVKETVSKLKVEDAVSKDMLIALPPPEREDRKS